MKIGIYNPYVDSFGGGERYVLTLAEHWSKMHSVSIFWDEKNVLSEAQKRFGLDLSLIKVVPNVFSSGNILKKLSVSKTFDCIFFLSDGSVPMSLAAHNILHFQVPFAKVILPWWKASRYQKIVCNSQFTKKFLDPAISVPRSVIYPPVDTEKIKSSSNKTNTILTVGRFSSLYGAKKQDVLIDAFKLALKKKELSGWNLILAGGLLESDRKYLDDLKVKAAGLPVEFYPNCSFDKLQSLYSTARIYWHAAGYGETKPEHMEHFGITTVEAMAAGCIPVVYNGGGQSEIVTEGKSGFLWKTSDELVQKTIQVIRKNDTFPEISTEAKKKAEEFSKGRFTKSFDLLLSQL